MLGEKVKKLREQQNMTQHELALKSGVDQTLISKIELGKTQTSIPTLTRIAVVLSTTPSKLMENDEESKK